MSEGQLLITGFVLAGVLGLLIGSFLNVCIYRIPRGEGIALEPSHCPNCKTRLKWFELIPLFSWIGLKGKCRTCKHPISKQYPIVEASNMLLYLLIVWVCGFQPVTVLYCLMASALLVLSVIDIRTFEIPFGINLFIGVLGLFALALDYKNWHLYVIGFFAVSVPLLLVSFITRGRGIGGGDIKLMAAAGLLIGWKNILLAFFLGCIIGSVIHLIRMAVSKAGRVLAMGPYLAAGILLAALWGETFLKWYLGMFRE
ncbi:MAG: prepilin peptidase [Lachnospiraceae bacterium]|nr:prepilin peptidase [Lachnospiraceae bacterium]